MLYCHHCGKLLGAGKVYKVVLDNGDIYSHFHGTNVEGFFNQSVSDGVVSCCAACYAVPGRALQSILERDAKKIADWPKAAPESREALIARLGERLAGTETRPGESISDARARVGLAELTRLEKAEARFREPSAADLAALSKRRLA